jgi:AAHS family benzoate transporter-like MFS transporter
VPGVLGALAVCFINVKHSHDKKAESAQQELLQLDPVVADE